jgi:ribosomal protein S18 acetylase RimI-like enzyme
MNSEMPRQAVIADLPAIKRVIEAAYSVYLGRMDRPPAPVLHDYRDEAEAGAIWVMGDPIRALIVLVADGDSMLVDNVAVEPSAQGSGLGRLLMAFAEERAVALGLSRVTLYTNEVMTENLAFYARLGYRETARRSEHGYRRVFMEKTPGQLHLTLTCGRRRQGRGGKRTRVR